MFAEDRVCRLSWVRATATERLAGNATQPTFRKPFDRRPLPAAACRSVTP